MAYEKIKGTGLLEIMIALLLSAIVLAGIFRYAYYLETSLKSSASKVESIEKDSVLFAWLIHDIEMAGNVGCVNAHSRQKIIDAGHYLSSTWLIANGHDLESQYMSSKQFQIIEKSSEVEVLISGDNHFKENDVVFIQNCWEAETLKIKKIHSVHYGEKNRLEFYTPMQLKNFDNTYVAKLIRHHYFIENSNGLYVRNENGDSDEVLENISDIAISSSQNRFTVSVTELNNPDPMIFSTSAYNAY